MLTVRPLTFGTSRGLTPAGSVLLPYGGSFSNGAMVVICAAAGAAAIATPASAEAPARNSRRENSGLVVPFMLSLPGRPTYREGLRNASTAAYAIPQAPPGQRSRYGRGVPITTTNPSLRAAAAKRSSRVTSSSVD